MRQRFSQMAVGDVSAPNDHRPVTAIADASVHREPLSLSEPAHSRVM